MIFPVVYLDPPWPYREGNVHWYNLWTFLSASFVESLLIWWCRSGFEAESADPIHTPLWAEFAMLLGLIGSLLWGVFWIGSFMALMGNWV